MELTAKEGEKNFQLRKTIKELKKASIENDAAIWKRVAEDLDKPNRDRRAVNIYKIERNAKDGETIVVPGKVLGTGELNKDVKVAAYNFSSSAYRKVKEAGEALTLKELVDNNPEGEGVRILG